MEYTFFDRARRFISQVLLVFLAMLLITSGIWGSPTNLAYRHLFLDSMMIICLMKKPFSKNRKPLADVLDFTMAALVLWIAVYVLYDINAYQLRVGFGAVGSALNVFLEDYLKVMYDITPESIVANGGSVSYMSDSEMSSAMADGTIDVGFALGTYPKTSPQELENSPGLRLISFGEDLDKYLETNPGWGKFTIPEGTYMGQDTDYETATSWAIMSIASDMDEELVYRLTRVAWENIEEEGEACAAIRNFMKLEDTLKPMSGAELHPGAARYYKEIGLLKE